MKDLKDFISEKKQYIVKVPKNIYTTGTMKAKELVDQFNNEFDFDSSSLFAGLMDKNFDYIYCIIVKIMIIQMLQKFAKILKRTDYFYDLRHKTINMYVL